MVSTKCPDEVDIMARPSMATLLLRGSDPLPLVLAASLYPALYRGSSSGFRATAACAAGRTMASRVASHSAACPSDDAIEALLGVVRTQRRCSLHRCGKLRQKQATQRRDQAREALDRDLEATRYAGDRAFRQYDAADPANRLVASELEARWNQALAGVAEVESRIGAHAAALPTRGHRCGTRSPTTRHQSEDGLVPARQRTRLKKRIDAHPNPRGRGRHRRYDFRDRDLRALVRRRSQRRCICPKRRRRTAQQHSLYRCHRGRSRELAMICRRRSDALAFSIATVSKPATAIVGPASASPRCDRTPRHSCVQSRRPTVCEGFLAQSLRTPRTFLKIAPKTLRLAGRSSAGSMLAIR